MRFLKRTPFAKKMHHIYETKGFVLSAAASGEADRQFLFYTREFGLVRAIAQGVRKVQSKLRYSLQAYSLSTLNLVHGRAGWRLTSARLEKDYYARLRADRRKLIIVTRMFSLLRRMVHGEERNTVLFDVLETGLEFLPGLSDGAARDFEVLLVLRILHQLGYVGSSEFLSPLVSDNSWSEEVLRDVAFRRHVLVRSVNESLNVSHL